MTTNSKNKRWFLRLIVTILIVSGIGLFALPHFVNTPPRLNSVITDIDVSSGRIRCETFLVWLRVKSKITETVISKEHRNFFGELSKPTWKRISSVPIGAKVSPHYAYHGSYAATLQIDEAFSNANFTLAARKEIVREFLNMLQKDENDNRAREYAFAIWKLSLDEQIADSLVDTNMLPDGS